MLNLVRLKADSNTPQALKNILSSYDWQKSNNGYRAKQHGSYSIYCKKNKWLFAAHNGDYKGGDALSVAAEVNNLDLKTKDGLYQAAAIVCQAAGLRFERYCTDTDSEQVPSKAIQSRAVIETKQWIPNAGQELKKSFDSYELAAKDSPQYQAALNFYKPKTGVESLETFGVFPLLSVTYLNGKKRNFSATDFAYLYASSGWKSNIKIKNPTTKDKKYKVLHYQNTGNYVHGLHNLPEHEQRKNYTLILAGGEDDTNCINANLQAYGFCAMTFGGEKAFGDESYLNHLRTQFKTVICLLDTDDTGKKMMVRNAVKYGLPYIDLSDYDLSNCKDVCDVYQKYGLPKLLQSVEIGAYTKKVISESEKRIGYDLHNVLNLNIEKYISETTEKLEQFKTVLLRYHRLLMKSPTDTGKTRAIIELSKDPYFFKQAGIEYIIFIVPRLLLAEQIQSDFIKHTVHTPVIIDGKADTNDIEAAAHSKVIICTIDSLPKVRNLVSSSLVVCDELHLLFEDVSFRNDVCAKAFHILDQAKRVLAMSATPFYELCIGRQLSHKIPENIKESLDYTLLNVQLVKDQKKTATVKIYNSSRATVLCNHAENAANDHSKHIILLNDVKLLETAAEKVNDRHGEATATILSSKKPCYNIESPTYNALKNDEPLPDANRLILGTNIFAAGISLNVDVASVAIFGEATSRTITQFAARPRRKDGINQNGTIEIYKKGTEEEYKSILSEFEQKKIETDASLKDYFTSIDSLENDIQYAIKSCDRANGLKEKATAPRRKFYDELSDIVFDEDTNEWIPNITKIIFRHSQIINKRLTVYGKLWLAQRYDETIDICPPQYFKLKEDAEAKEILGVKKIAEKQVKELAYDIFAENLKACLEIVFKQTFDKDLKDSIKTEITPQKELSNAAKEIHIKYPSVTDGVLIDVTTRYFGLKEACIGVPEIKKKDIPILLNINQKNNDYELIKNRIITQSELQQLKTGQLLTVEKIRAENSLKIIDAVTDFKKSKRKNWATAGELIYLISKATGKRKIELQAAKLRVAEVFSLATEQRELNPNNDKRTTVYIIGNRLTMNKVLKKGLPKCVKKSTKNSENLTHEKSTQLNESQ